MSRISRTLSSRTDLLLRRTRLHFPRLDEEQVEIRAIEKGGSDRKFYRVCTGEQTLILVKYNLEREENRHYVAIAQFLAANDVRVPKIYFHDPDEGLIWIEDLGKRDLWSFREQPWNVRVPLYASALQEVAKLHCFPETTTREVAKSLPAEFDAALYRWEQSYFFENCLSRYFEIDGRVIGHCAALPALAQIAERLAARPRVLVHRDFQSQNILIREDAYLIDFQGMRPGLAEYDLASLLYDPYVELRPNEREELFEKYAAQRERCAASLPNESREVLKLCAMQRLMQALGAYGFLGLVKGNSAFLAHIPAAMRSLREIVSELDGLEELRGLLDQLS